MGTFEGNYNKHSEGRVIWGKILIGDAYKVLKRLGWNVNPEKWITE